MPDKPVIILIAPQLGENIGAAARGMLNFGLTDLRIVNPRDGWPNPKAVDMAKGAKDVIKKARIFTSLKDATHDITRLYATTARTRDMVKKVYDARETAANIIQNNGKSAIMFGPERSGLNNDDITLADAVSIIPVAPIYTSLNLAQAVNIMCYEWFVATSECSNGVSDSQGFATKEEVANLFEHLETELDKTDFFRIEDKRPKMVRNIRNIFSRNDLTEQEVRTLRGIIKSLTNNR
ncbi:MAG: RNA methyltransferase [Rickettsiales bacterium]|nr:RNA methyltransferase [Pseudomonadota bacterium]MDA0966575.1 RNA methyltransferase [Pseudomonadota bacterium]MDG4543604.1 RNA methyltransferase [Rickettsiales bacterium]MDG4545751.1 RNA methyltransferase [Rickettsiales bacterium]MDG4547476.1 RNA methyltransferase [Rickettsiales bacterium]